MREGNTDARELAGADTGLNEESKRKILAQCKDAKIDERYGNCELQLIACSRIRSSQFLSLAAHARCTESLDVIAQGRRVW